MAKRPKFIFVVGGVISGVGKGTTVATIGFLLSRLGYRVTAVKIDPYLNVDAGTMNPTEHGEVFVTQDGLESDQDLGNYERFLGYNLTRANYMTTGQVYLSVINRERSMGYKGKCVQILPHVSEEIIERLIRAASTNKADIVIVEIGGTVGDYENIVFLEAGRILNLRRPGDVMWTLVSYLPVPGKLGEMKSKPTQHAVRALNSSGIQPDLIIGRSEHLIDEVRKQKISVFCNVQADDVISAPDVATIYDIPINFNREKVGEKILKKLGLAPKQKINISDWKRLAHNLSNGHKKLKIGIIGKYFETGSFVLSDSYISVIEAVKHAASAVKITPQILWLDAGKYEEDPKRLSELKECDALIVPGGFGSRGVEGKIKAIEYARNNKIPFLGLCYGMQLAAIEFARNVAHLKGAHTTECDPKTKYPVIDIMHMQRENLAQGNYGGSMRLGDYECRLEAGTQAARAYRTAKRFYKDEKHGIILERHRHRYEFNNDYRSELEKKGLVFSGVNPEHNLVEILELKNHPFFMATQFHPEFTSRPLQPHPLFVGLLRAAL